MADTQEEPTITMTVKALQALLAERTQSTYWARFHRREDQGYDRFRDCEVVHTGQVGDEMEFLFRLRENGTRILKEVRLNTADIFDLAPNVRRLINDKANGE